MSTADKLQILFPVGRLVQGSVSDPQTKDASGNPLVIKRGPDAGKPTQKFYFAIAIPKSPPGSPGVDPSTGAPVAASPHNHWSCTEWGQKIWAKGWASWPNGQCGSPQFAWKIEDGDSTIPNQRGVTNAKKDGMPGCWIVHLSSSYAVKTYDAKGTVSVDPKSIKRGHYVEVYGSVAGNNEPTKPGIYINHGMVAHAGFGPEISSGPDPSAVGFGKTALPPGASATPAPSMQPPAAGAAPAIPPPAAAPAPAVATAPAPAPTAVTPHAGFYAPVAAAAPPPPAAAPAPPAGPVWKGPAPGYDGFKAAGWSDDQMRAAGYIA